MENTFPTKVRIPKGIYISEPERSGSVVETCTLFVTEKIARTSDKKEETWSYLFVHHAKVGAFINRLANDEMRYFIHKTIIYQRNKHSRGICEIEKPTVSGLIFIQGIPRYLQNYLDANFPNYHLVNNCSTHLPAVIPDSVMQPFMRVLETSPERIRFLLHPFRYYAGGNIKLRLTSGFFAGLEGYVIRIDRDRRLVMDVGGMSVAISGIHCEKFEVVEEEAEKYRQVKSGICDAMSLKRNLTDLQKRIDRELYIPSNQQEIGLIADVLEMWKERAAIYLEKWQVAEAKEILFFLLEEIDYHYSSLLASKTFDMSSIISSARLIANQIDAMTLNPKITEETRQEIAAERDSCLPRFGYLFA